MRPSSSPTWRSRALAGSARSSASTRGKSPRCIGRWLRVRKKSRGRSGCSPRQMRRRARFKSTDRWSTVPYCSKRSAFSSAHPGNPEFYNMPSTAIDSSLFGNFFSSEAMRKVFSDENRIRKYLEFEGALATVQGRLGIIPADAAAEISANCVLDKIDMNKLRRETERIGSPVLGVVQQLSAMCRDGLGEYCHWGATT